MLALEPPGSPILRASPHCSFQTPYIQNETPLIVSPATTLLQTTANFLPQTQEKRPNIISHPGSKN